MTLLPQTNNLIVQCKVLALVTKYCYTSQWY